MEVYSPVSGRKLEPTSIPNIYKDTAYGSEFIVNNGIVISIISPASGGTLVRNSDGTYNDPYISQTFSFDDRRNAFIPHYIPDDTMEPAHIDGDFLVGNDSGRRFAIDANGKILTPEELAFQARHGEDIAMITMMEADGSINEYLKKTSQRSREIKQMLEQKRQDGTLDSYFKSLLNVENPDVLEHFDEMMERIGELNEDELDELMTHFNAGRVDKVGWKIRSYIDPVKAAKINARYRVLTGKDHPIFLEKILPIIDSYMSSKEALLKVGGYFNEQYFADLASIQKYVNSVYTRENNMNRIDELRQFHESQGIILPPEYYEVEELRDKVKKGELTAEDLKHLCDMTFGVDTTESQLVYNFIIQSGHVAPPQEDMNVVGEVKLK